MMMPSLSLTYWSALVIAGTALVFFGGRQIGASRGIMRLRDLTLTSAVGYSFLVVTLYQAAALYFGPGATFFKWAVHGVIGFGIAGWLFQQLGRHVGTSATKKLFRSMPVTAALGILLILAYAIVAIFADFIAPYGQAEIFKDANVLPGGNPE
ncbi:MAG: ABC transporter permease, partial [Candidatus Puniceispirillaceae bacterium]